jgi:hypothetical protein
VPERWLDPGIAGLRAEVCQVRSTREETALLFGGRNRAERCILLRPALAKELAAGLAALLREYEAGLNATPAGRIESRAADAEVPQGARAMHELVRRLVPSFGLERSFKLSPGRVRDDRVIFGLRRALLERDALLDACSALRMPQDYVSQVDAALEQANTVGFGYEGDDAGGVYKVYLEFWDALRARLQREPRNLEPTTLFLGFKWPARGGPGALARYTCYPLLPVAGIAERLRALYDGAEASPSCEAALAILEFATRRIGDDSFVYVEAAEDGNPRKSFDLNLYKARLSVRELKAPLAALAEHFAIEPAATAGVLATERQLGHLSGGRGRDGRDFLTVYYEIEGL